MVRQKKTENASRIVVLYKIYKMSLFMTRCFGVLTLPCCFLGMICLALNEDDKRDMKYLFKIVDMYGVEVLNKLAPLVAKEHELFLRACREVNEGGGVTIYPNVTLLDALRVGMPSVGGVLCILDSSGLGRYGGGKDKEEYLGLVYKRYIELGGNIGMVVYGLPEYVAIIYDIRDHEYIGITEVEYFRQITGATQLHELVMSYKDKVVF